MERIEDIIHQFKLEPHPEGGYFRETYRSSGVIKEEHLSSQFNGSRHFSTCIYFLLTSNSFSAFHKINQDEIWHFYKGSSLSLHVLSPEGHHTVITIGSDIEKGEIPQYVVPAGHYFAAEVNKESSFAFVGCTVSPGFDFRDFDLPKRSLLLQKFPQHSNIITTLTR